MIPTVGGFACHAYHWPRPEDADLHHVVPRAWQNVWAPDGVPAQLAGSRAEESVRGHVAIRTMLLPDAVLWHTETIKLPPTCHRAVHNRIVEIMKAFGQVRLGAEPMDEQLEAVIKSVSGRGKLWEIAERAPRAWLEAGGSLSLLVGRKQWGDS